VGESEATIVITHAAPEGAKLRANKGINLPESNLCIASLTSKDLEDLAVVAAQADIVGMSFVRTPADVEALEAQLALLGRREIGILLKIETRKAFDELPALVLAAMRRPAAGVMIARGDLAVECGFERMAEIQEEILWVCEAAHMPVVWATQVLETLSRTGLPSRAEITDAAMGERAECVMLNKGPHLVDAVAALADILHRMQNHQVKKSAMLRRLRRW
jgi:pyruvate kinase